MRPSKDSRGYRNRSTTIIVRDTTRFLARANHPPEARLTWAVRTGQRVWRTEADCPRYRGSRRRRR